MKYLIFIILSFTSINAVTLSNNNSKIKQRKLSETDLLEDRILENEEKLSVEKVKEEITDLHKNVKLCIDEHFSRDPVDVLAYNEILEDCTGENFSIILRFYNSVNFEVKEITKEKIKNKLKDGFCNDVLFECITFFKTMELFIDKDFDLLKSFEFNTKELERKIQSENLSYLLDLTQGELEDYDTIRQDLLDEREFLTRYFKEKLEDYETKFGSLPEKKI